MLARPLGFVSHRDNAVFLSKVAAFFLDHEQSTDLEGFP